MDGGDRGAFSMKREMSREPQFYTSPEWINREGPDLGRWPLAKKAAGDRSRLKSGGTLKGLAGIRKLEALGLFGKEGVK